MTQALAIVGAVTGVTGAILALVSIARDRAKIVVTSSTSFHSRSGWSVEVFVANHGRQPIAITRAGIKEIRRLRLSERLGAAVGSVLEAVLKLLFRVGVSSQRLARWQREGGWFYRIFGEWTAPDQERRDRSAIDEPVLLGLADLAHYELRVPDDLDEREWRLYAYATDSYRRTVLSRFPVFLYPSEMHSLNLGSADPHAPDPADGIESTPRPREQRTDEHPKHIDGAS
jgi:hypothetical protein